jgi:hypothetical protein
MSVNVRIEGESKLRPGRVLYTRGASAKLGRSDLAAAAGEGNNRVGQALIILHDYEPGPRDCPIGQAASVDFPDIGFFQIVSAYLRL